MLTSIYLITPIAGAKQLGGALKYIPDHTNGIVINTLEPKWLRLGVYIVDRRPTHPTLLIDMFELYVHIYAHAKITRGAK